MKYMDTIQSTEHRVLYLLYTRFSLSEALAERMTKTWPQPKKHKTKKPKQRFNCTTAATNSQKSI